MSAVSESDAKLLEIPAGIRWERASCAICGSQESTVFGRVSRLVFNRPGLVRIVRCRDCGHLYQDPRPTRDTIGLYYTEDYGPHVEPSGKPSDPGRTPARQPWYLSPWARRLSVLRAAYYWLAEPYSDWVIPPPHAGARALELGCGTGHYLDKLLQAGWEAEGLEPAAEPSERCRTRGLSVQTGEFESAQFPEGHYDLVAAWMVLEHLHDPGAALRKIRRLLRPDGSLLLSVPNTGCWERAVFGRHYYVFSEPTHLQHFSPRALRRLLCDCGFSRHRIFYHHNIDNIVGSVGLLLQNFSPGRRLGQRLLHFCQDPTMWGRLALAPAGKLMASLRQTGRLTILARPDRDSRESF